MSLKSQPPHAALEQAEDAIADRAASYPEVTEDNPWGHRAFKVRGKTFLFLGADRETLSLSVKLPASGGAALELPFTEPTHYGLGKSGWVTARFSVGADIPLSLIEKWLDESFRAIAPKRLVASLHEAEAPSASKAPAKRARKSRG